VKSALPDDHKVETWQELCLALGGADDSFTGHLVTLIAKADPANRARLRAGFPKQVAAWERWVEASGRLTVADLYAALATVPDR
jgi:hypothetical protein